MAITNSFHTSSKKHAISSTAKLSSCELHNGRGYHSYFYDEKYISDIFGTAKTLSADTEAFINSTFAGAIDKYNDKQKRQDRKIDSSAFDYFCENKNLDIANEFILQLGSKEFWDKYRIDTVIQTRKGEKVLKDFPEEVKTVMNGIFKKQGEAYERIYETHGAVILEKIKTDKAAAEKVMSEFSDEERQTFFEILSKKTKDRKALIEELPEPDKYYDYAEAAETLATIKKLKLEERIENEQMHIKIINEVGHYDEFSPHGHGISVCWADGYENGLQSRVAKSVVLNKWSLSVIQDRMREIAQEEMQKHPEIFAGEILEEKQIGRTLNYTTEQFIRKQQQELLNQKESLQKEKDVLKSEIDTITKQGHEIIEKHKAESRELEGNILELQDKQFLLMNQINEIIENEAEVLEDMVDRTVENVLTAKNGLYDDAFFYLAHCSDEEFLDVSEKGYNLKKDYVKQNVDDKGMQDGFEELVNQIEQAQTISWQERQEFWNEYKEMTDMYWNVYPDLQKDYKATISKGFTEKYILSSAYYDALHTLRTTNNIFVMMYMAVKAMFLGIQKNALENELNELIEERKNLIEKTANFKKFCKEYREDLKQGIAPNEKYLDKMSDLVSMVYDKRLEFDKNKQNLNDKDKGIVNVPEDR